jgi:hypothetical protein
MVCIIFGIGILLVSCRGKQEAARQIHIADSSLAANAQPVPRRDPVFDDRYLQRQALRSAEARKSIDSLKALRTPDLEELRKIILRRKGEIIFALKDIRKNSMLPEQVRDSLAAPLDSEAIDLAEELFDLEKR